ncbi:MAG: type IV toxin-antitoxin system AbiEi family antitoxin domain-containing protein [Kiritimatiellae bacterium]|nr:type IV toxin-antitoxin system AbiEi family antitoxin domain-containing protein [Kiritimatiellia bacterium]
MPKWFSGTYSGRFVCTRSCFFSDETGIEYREAACAVSSPERAFLELAADVPQKVALGELYQLMEFADTLRPKLVSKLLTKCGSVKAKRVFLFLADDLGHRWAKKVDLS